MKHEMKTKLASTETRPPDLRTSYAKALDLGAERYGAWVPDRPIVGAADAGQLISLAIEHGRRVHNRYTSASDPRVRRAYAHCGLRDALDQVPKLLRDVALTENELRRLLDRIAATIERLEDPGEAPTVPDAWRELARDLGLALPRDVAKAGRDLSLAIDGALNISAARERAPWHELRAGLVLDDRQHIALEAEHGIAVSVDERTKRARAALAGYGLPAVRGDDDSFRATRDELAPALTALDHTAMTRGGPEPMPWLKRLGELLRLPFPSFPADEARAIATEQESRLEQIRADRKAERIASTDDVKNHGPDAHAVAEERARKAIVAEAEAKRAALRDRHHRELIAHRWRIAAAIDATLAELEERELGSLRCYWVRRLRAIVVDGAEAEGANGLAADLSAWTYCMSLGVTFQTKETL